MVLCPPRKLGWSPRGHTAQCYPPRQPPAPHPLCSSREQTGCRHQKVTPRWAEPVQGLLSPLAHLGGSTPLLWALAWNGLEEGAAETPFLLWAPVFFSAALRSSGIAPKQIPACCVFILRTCKRPSASLEGCLSYRLQMSPVHYP